MGKKLKVRIIRSSVRWDRGKASKVNAIYLGKDLAGYIVHRTPTDPPHISHFWYPEARFSEKFPRNTFHKPTTIAGIRMYFEEKSQ